MDEYIISLLGKIKYPGFSRDIVSFGLVREASLTGVKAFVKIELTSADPTIPQTLKQEIEKTLLESDKIKEVEVSIILKKGNSQNGHTEQESGSGHSMVKKIIAIAQARFTATVDFPTPPLPLAMAIIFLTIECPEPLSCSV